MIYWIKKVAEKLEQEGHFKILLATKVEKLIVNDKGKVTGVKISSTTTTKDQLIADNVIIATGGFINDRSESSLLK